MFGSATPGRRNRTNPINEANERIGMTGAVERAVVLLRLSVCVVTNTSRCDSHQQRATQRSAQQCLLPLSPCPWPAQSWRERRERNWRDSRQPSARHSGAPCSITTTLGLLGHQHKSLRFASTPAAAHRTHEQDSVNGAPTTSATQWSAQSSWNLVCAVPARRSRRHRPSMSGADQVVRLASERRRDSRLP